MGNGRGIHSTVRFFRIRIADRPLALRVGHDMGIEPARRRRQVEDANDLPEPFRIGKEVRQNVRKALEDLPIELRFRIVWIDGKVDDLRLDEVEEEMGPIGDLGVPDPAPEGRW
ncbi:MAG: hypothetical protein NTW71_03845 [Deltaproteobacteria bacterium]|nr:hypothetical protein [Deltaproteobacteria bacterium]